MVTARPSREPLSYTRFQIAAGTEIGYADSSVRAAIGSAETIVIALSFTKIGDSLLFLSAARAFYEFRALAETPRPVWAILGPHASLLSHMPQLSGARLIRSIDDLVRYIQTGVRKLAVITDIAHLGSLGSSFIYRKDDFHHPIYVESLPCGNVKEHRSLSARYYLTAEKNLGMRLSTEPEYAHAEFLFSGGALQSRDPFCHFDTQTKCCALVATTSLPEKKQFGIYRFLNVARRLRWSFNGAIAFILVVSPSQIELSAGSDGVLYASLCKEYGVEICYSSDLSELGSIFSRCALVIGNDTGLTHLSSMSRTPHRDAPPVIILYSRHDYTRWSTGGANVTPLYTAFSEYLRENDLATITDQIDDKRWGAEASASSISERTVVEAALRLLS